MTAPDRAAAEGTADAALAAMDPDDWAADVKVARARVAALEAVADLVPKWLSEAADYPMTSEGLHAAAGVRLCAKELRAALDAVSAAETGSGSAAATDAVPAADPTTCHCTDYAPHHRPGTGLCVQEPMPMKIRDAR